MQNSWDNGNTAGDFLYQHLFPNADFTNKDIINIFLQLVRGDARKAASLSSVFPSSGKEKKKISAVYKTPKRG